MWVGLRCSQGETMWVVLRWSSSFSKWGKILKGFPVQEPGYQCESCGDVRFVSCLNCSGNRKVFDESEGMLKKCLEYNENGLIRNHDRCSWANLAFQWSSDAFFRCSFVDRIITKFFYIKYKNQLGMAWVWIPKYSLEGW